MKQIQVVRSSNGQDVVPGVPLCMQDLPVEVQAVHAHLVLPLPARGRDTLVAQDAPQGAHVPGGLVAVVCAGLAVKDPEEVVVSSCDNFTVTTPAESRKGNWPHNTLN